MSDTVSDPAPVDVEQAAKDAELGARVRAAVDAERGKTGRILVLQDRRSELREELEEIDRSLSAIFNGVDALPAALAAIAKSV